MIFLTLSSYFSYKILINAKKFLSSLTSFLWYFFIIIFPIPFVIFFFISPLWTIVFFTSTPRSTGVVKFLGFLTIFRKIIFFFHFFYFSISLYFFLLLYYRYFKEKKNFCFYAPVLSAFFFPNFGMPSASSRQLFSKFLSPGLISLNILNITKKKIYKIRWNLEEGWSSVNTTMSYSHCPYQTL